MTVTGSRTFARSDCSGEVKGQAEGMKRRRWIEERKNREGLGMDH